MVVAALAGSGAKDAALNLFELPSCMRFATYALYDTVSAAGACLRAPRVPGGSWLAMPNQLPDPRTVPAGSPLDYHLHGGALYRNVFT